MDEEERKQVLVDVRDPTRGEWPAELRDLPNDKWRLFAIEYTANRNGAAACRAAGFCTPDSTAEAFAKQAYKLLSDDRMVEAIAALAKRQIRSLAPAAVQAVRDVLATPYHKDQMRAAAMVLDRTDAPTQKVDITHTHKFDPVQVTLKELVRLKQSGLAREAIMTALGLETKFELEHYEGLLANGQGPIVDAEYVELPVPDGDPDFNPDGTWKGE